MTATKVFQPVALLLLLLVCNLCQSFQPTIQPSSCRFDTRLGLFDLFKPPDDKKAKEEEEAPAAAPAPEYDDADPVEKLFSVFFGKKEETKRLCSTLSFWICEIQIFTRWTMHMIR